LQTSRQISAKSVNICNTYSKFSKVTQQHKLRSDLTLSRVAVFFVDTVYNDGKLQTKSRRRQSSTPAVRQSAEDDRSAVSNGQLWSSGFGSCRPVDLEFAAIQSSRPISVSLSIFRRHLKTHFFCEILTIRTQRIRVFL